MDTVKTREKLVKKALKIGIPEPLLKNLTSRSIQKIVEYDEEIKKDKDGAREVPGYRA